MIKSILSVFAGILVVVLLSVGTDMLLEKIGLFPPQSQGQYNTNLLAIALLYRTVYAFLGGWVTAHLAPANPMKLVKIVLIIGTVMGILGVIGGWNLSAHWYPIALVITSAIAVWFGGKMGIKGKSNL